MDSTPVSKCPPRTKKPSRDMPVSTLMWTFSVPPHAAAAALYSRALARADTAWVMRYSISWGTMAGGVCPKIRMGAWMPPWRSSFASSRLDTAR